MNTMPLKVIIRCRPNKTLDLPISYDFLTPTKHKIHGSKRLTKYFHNIMFNMELIKSSTIIDYVLIKIHDYGLQLYRDHS